MRRHLVYIQLEDDTIIGTVHLESLNNSTTRSQQLQTIEQHFKDHPKCIIAGDFNMGKGESSQLEGWDSIDHFTTYDGVLNKMARSRAKSNLDRIVYKGFNSEVQMVADKPYEDNIFLSDHFGLFGKFTS